MTRFVYGMRLRGFSLGAQPRGVVDHWDDPLGDYHDIIAYDRALTRDEMRAYDLDFIDILTE